MYKVIIKYSSWHNHNKKKLWFYSNAKFCTSFVVTYDIKIWR